MPNLSFYPNFFHLLWQDTHPCFSVTIDFLSCWLGCNSSLIEKKISFITHKSRRQQHLRSCNNSEFTGHFCAGSIRVENWNQIWHFSHVFILSSKASFQLHYRVISIDINSDEQTMGVSHTAAQQK